MPLQIHTYAHTHTQTHTKRIEGQRGDEKETGEMRVSKEWGRGGGRKGEKRGGTMGWRGI